MVKGHKQTGVLWRLTVVQLCLQMTLMTSWAVVCDVYFIEPQAKRPGESSTHFAERVQQMIAKKANLKIAPWDGYLKYYNLGKKVHLSLPSIGHLCLMQCS